MELLGADGATLTWPASVDWADGTEPSWSAGRDIVSFSTRDGGTTWYGYLGGQAFAIMSCLTKSGVALQI